MGWLGLVCFLSWGVLSIVGLRTHTRSLDLDTGNNDVGGTYPESGERTQIELPLHRVDNCTAPLVFDVGMARTGTSTICNFLRATGFKAKHGYFPHDTEGLLDSVREFIDDPLAIGNEFAALDSSGYSAFCDTPIYGMACPLYERYPSAKFIHVSRNFEQHFPSIQYMHCHWHKDWHCQKESLRSLQSIMWGEAMGLFCDNSEELCDGSNPTNSSIWREIKKVTRQRVREHDKEVRSCIPSSSRLELQTARLANDGGEILKFLGCDGLPGEMPTMHKIRTDNMW